MVDVMGHLAMGLLWAIPAWFVWTDRVSLAFVGFVVLAAPLPDIDVWIEMAFPSLIHHHGVTHTVVFVVLVAVIAGAVIAATLTGPIDRWLGSDRFDRKSLFAFSAGALLLGGLSHLFADMLSAPDISTPIEPFWPFFDKPWSVDLVWYNAAWVNVGLLTVAVVLHLGLWYASETQDHSYRMAGTR